ncbi:MAG: cytidylate kinase-like family protein [Dehalococcoidia bacterium]|nr:cytidylate kinase-like family protein [Dehalococcoidia bacterium]
MSRTVITIARQMGSGGDLIGSELAQTLGIGLIDQQIITDAAAAAGVSPETMMQAESAPSVLERMLEYLGQHTGGLDPLTDFSMEGAFTPALTGDSYRGLIGQFVRKTAAESDAVILRHAGGVVLREVPYVFRVLICAPVRLRIKRLQDYEHLSAVEADQRIRDDDKNRTDFFQTYYKVNWLNPALYDLCINTERVDVRAAVDVIIQAHKAASLGDA